MNRKKTIDLESAGAGGAALGPGVLDTDQVPVRALRREDLEAMVKIDQRILGRPRRSYLEAKLRDALAPGALSISLAAEEDGALAGFLIASLYYGEFGLPEPAAVLDTLAVDPERRGRKVGKAMLRQLETNLRGLGIEKVLTEVAWDQLDLLGFLSHAGFRPAPRFCLELDLET